MHIWKLLEKHNIWCKEGIVHQARHMETVFPNRVFAMCLWLVPDSCGLNRRHLSVKFNISCWDLCSMWDSNFEYCFVEKGKHCVSLSQQNMQAKPWMGVTKVFIFELSVCKDQKEQPVYTFWIKQPFICYLFVLYRCSLLSCTRVNAAKTYASTQRFWLAVEKVVL